MYFNTMFGKVLKKKTRDRNGVTYFEGKQRVPSLGPALLSLGLFLLLLLSGIVVVTTYKYKPHRWGISFMDFIDSMTPVFMIICLIFPFSLLTGGLWLLRMRQRLKPLSSTAEICSRFQIEESQLREKATEQGIRPRFNVNGEDLYDLADFGEAAILLRASSAPAPTEELLRPAANSETPQELLLRPATSGFASQRTRIKTDEDTQSVLYLTNRQED